MKQLGKYEGLRLLGRGPWTGVYLGRHCETGREYALKVFGTLERPRQEALGRAAARAALEHPHILKVHGLELDEAGGCCFLVMEYAAGGDLRKKLTAGAMDTDRALELTLQIARGLEAAHGKGLCHLNLKPENILFTGPGQVKLADLGLAACKAEPVLDEMARGEPGYLAPEHLEGSPGPAGDVYALGAVLLEMLTGRAPAGHPAGEEASPGIDVRARLEEAGLKNCADLASLLEMFLAPLPEDRPAHAGQAAAFLDLLLAGREPAAFNRTLEPAKRCDICQKPIPLSRSLCPICAGRAEDQAEDRAEADAFIGSVRQGNQAGESAKLRTVGLGLMMLLLLGAGLFIWRGGSAWLSAEQPPAAVAPAENPHAFLPRGVAILGAAAKVTGKAAEPQTEDRELRPGVREALYVSAAKAGSLGKAVRAELERSPQTLGARRNLALLLMQKGSYEKAARLLEGILKENPADGEAKSTLEMIAILSGRG